MNTNTPTNPKKFRIAIVGGGIAGLTCAVALKECSSSDVEIDLYEQAAQITEIGAGLTVWPRTWGLLTSLGLRNDLEALLKEKYSEEQKLAFMFRVGDRKKGFTFHEIFARGGSLPFHRQELQRTLLNHVPKFCNIHLSHRLIDFKEGDDSVKLIFKNGVEEEADILIAADGVKSVARKSIPNKGIFYTGTDAFRGLIPREAFAKLYPNHRIFDGPLIYCGKSQHIVVYPISADKIINVVAFTSKLENEGKPIPDQEIRDATREEVLESFSGWEEEVMQLLSSIENPSRWSIRDLRPLDTYISQRIALVGDAAHNMTPHLGAGAGQAMDDGYVLGKLLSKGTHNWPAALQAFNFVRWPYGNEIQRRAREQGFFFELNAPGFENITAKGQALAPEQISLLRDTITENWTWMEDDVEKDLMKATIFLEEKCQQSQT